MSASPTQPAAFALLFIENTSELVLYQGERTHSPDVCTLLGGKIGPETADDIAANPNAPENTDPHIRPFEEKNPWIGLIREIGEEAGYAFRAQNIRHAFDFISPYKPDQAMQIHIYTATIKADEFHTLRAQEGQGHFIKCDISQLNADSLNNPCGVSPLHNALIQVYKDNGITGKTFMSPADFLYPSIPAFQEQYLVQRRLKAA